MKEVYMDYAASAPLAEGVAEAMSSVSEGNASSIHAVGERARGDLDAAREELAAEIGAKTGEIIFTSGATESNNLALRGVVRSGLRPELKGKNDKIGNTVDRRKVIVSSIEHASVWEVAHGFEVGVVGVDSEGGVKIDELREMITSDTALVSVQHANNEFGTVQDIKEVGRICHDRGVLFHVDAAQTFGKLDIDVTAMGIDLLSASAHKIGGQKGVGLLYVREGVALDGLLLGGGQERGLRSGTENVAGAVGFSKALKEQKKVDVSLVSGLRDRLLVGLEELGGTLVGSRKERLWNIVQVIFDDRDGEDLVIRLSERGVMAATGSACSSRKEDGRVLEAIGLDGKGAVRFSLGAEHTEEDMDFVLDAVRDIVKG